MTNIKDFNSIRLTKSLIKEIEQSLEELKRSKDNLASYRHLGPISNLWGILLESESDLNVYLKINKKKLKDLTK